MNLTYRSHARVEDLKPNECTVHRAAYGNGKRGWLLWFYVYREDKAGVLEDCAVPVSPCGGPSESGPGGRTWGLAPVGGGTWQVSPSINVQADKSTIVGDGGSSIWHQTPAIVGVPDGEPWASGGDP